LPFRPCLEEKHEDSRDVGVEDAVADGAGDVSGGRVEEVTKFGGEVEVPSARE